MGTRRRDVADDGERIARARINVPVAELPALTDAAAPSTARVRASGSIVGQDGLT